MSIGPGQEHLGFRQVGELLLEGVGTTADITTPDGESPTAETWLYFPQTGGMHMQVVSPVIMEQRFTLGGGSLIETVVTDVRSAFVTADLFDPPAAGSR